MATSCQALTEEKTSIKSQTQNIYKDRKIDNIGRIQKDNQISQVNTLCLSIDIIIIFFGLDLSFDC